MKAKKKAVKTKTKAVKTKTKKKELKKVQKKTEKKEEKKEEKKYFEAIGRRKRSVARVRVFTKGPKKITINEKDYKDFFPILENQKKVISPLEEVSCVDKFGISVKVEGGGTTGQAEAVRHGIARALVLLNLNFRKKIKKAGYLTRDPRKRERKKFGLKRARRAPQWKKR